MERLLADAKALTGVDYNIDNLGDVYDAIHVIQGDLGLTGVAAEEASQTFSGSFDAMKAAAKNFLGSLAIGENVGQALSTLLSTVNTFFFNNFLPMLGTIIRSLPGAVAVFLKEGIPMLLTSVQNLITTLANYVSSLADGLTSEKVAAWVKTTLPKVLATAGKLIAHFAMALIKNIPKILVALGKIGLAIIKGLGSALFGKVSAAAAGIRDRFMRPINEIKEKFSRIIETIKGWFPIRLGDIFGGIKLPHFDVEWSSITAFGKTIDFPSGFDIDWYANGGIFNSPTIAGIGEIPGGEAVVPLNKFWDKLDNMQAGGDITINVYSQPGMDVNQLALKVEQRLVQLQKQRNKAYG